VLASGEGHPHKPGDGAVRLWDAATLRPLRTLEGLNGAAVDLLFSADGKHLLAIGCSFDLPRMVYEKVSVEEATTCEARLWEVATGMPIETRPQVSALAWSADGKIAAESKLDRQVRVWEFGTNKIRFSHGPMPGLVCALVFSPCGRWLACLWQQVDLVGARTGRLSPGSVLTGGVTVWRVDDGKVQLTAPGGTTPAFSKDGKQMFVATLEGMIHCWDVEQGLETKVLRGHTNTVSGLALRPAGAAGGPLLATAGMDTTIRLWDPISGRALQTVGTQAKSATSVRFSADGTRLFSAGLDGRIKAWNLTATRGFRRLEGVASLGNVLSFDPAGRFLALAGREDIAIWDVRMGKSVPSLAGTRRCAVFAPRGTLLAVGAGREVRLLDTAGLATGKPMAPVRSLVGLAGTAEQLAWHPDAKYLAAASTTAPENGLISGDLFVWDATTGKELWRHLPDNGPVVGLAWTPDGKRLALLTLDRTVEIRDGQSSELLLTLNRGTHRATIYGAMGSVGFSPDGKLLAAAGGNALDAKQPATILVWDVATGRLVARLEGHTALVSGLSFHPDGKRLASASCDVNLGMFGEVKLWDIPGGNEVVTLAGRVGVGFSPDGRLLASVGSENIAQPELRLWDGPPPSDAPPTLAPAASSRTLKK
jgi:WD40 repeat protein